MGCMYGSNARLAYGGRRTNVVLVISNFVMSMPPYMSEMYSMYAGTTEK